MPASENSKKEEFVEIEEIIVLKELNEALQILESFRQQSQDARGYSPCKKAQSLLEDARKHNDDIAARSKKILAALHNRALYSFSKNYSAFMLKEEDTIILTTLNISAHITLLNAQLSRLLEMSVQSVAMEEW